MNTHRGWLLLAGVAGGGLLLYLLRPVLTPFVAGALLAYMGDPLVDRLEAARLPRTVAVVVVFCAIFLGGLALALFLVPIVEQQFEALFERLPAFIDWLRTAVAPAVATAVGAGPDGAGADTLKRVLLDNWKQTGGVAVAVVNELSRSGLALIGALGTLVLTPVVTFYLLRDWDVLVARCRDLLPRRVEPRVVALATECDRVLAEFFRGQLLVMGALGSIYSVGLWLVGLDLALLIGMIAGLVSFVPYMGLVLGALLAVLAALFQFQALLPVALVGLVFVVGQILEGMVLTPLLVGDRIGLHPVAVIFAVLAGGQLFGFVGVLLALPAAAVVVVLLRHAHDSYVDSGLYRNE